MRYWPNPVHKTETTEAGPPVWRYDKTRCPKEITVAERLALLQESVTEQPDQPRAPRYAVRRVTSGLEFYQAMCHDVVEDEPEFHAYPVTFVPCAVLREFRDRGAITGPEYKRLVRDML
jgi:hypothetical protein